MFAGTATLGKKKKKKESLLEFSTGTRRDVWLKGGDMERYKENGVGVYVVVEVGGAL